MLKGVKYVAKHRENQRVDFVFYVVLNDEEQLNSDLTTLLSLPSINLRRSLSSLLWTIIYLSSPKKTAN